ncbi:phospholipase [Pseudorhodoferax sp. Leaf267]|nr:phospholipase [Pseudorhodoferax sp. Leaf267]
MLRIPFLLSPLALLLGWASQAQAQTAVPAPGSVPSWQTCAAQAGDDAARLRCFDAWARQQATEAAAVNAQAAARTPQQGATTNKPASTGGTATTAVVADTPLAAPEAPVVERCHDTRYSVLSRVWELESGTDCGVLSLRGYRPVSLSLAQSSSVNRTPGTPNPENQSTEVEGYRRTEARIQLSVRTKLAQGLLTPREGDRVDSLWLGYSQQSFWQVFSPELSRPFRATDHEPELIYVYPTYAELGSWRLRYSGLGIVHQSNGQNLPLSRSWNRVYLMAGAESKDERFRVTGRVWHRLSEDAKSDDNPDITDYIGRAEITGGWTLSNRDNLSLTLRHPLKTNGKGSARFEWQHALGPQGEGWLRSGLRLHTQIFHGYGDSLIDYNVRKTVFSVGLSLMDF